MTKQKLVPFFDKKGRRQNNFYYDQTTLVLYFEKRHGGQRVKFSTKTTVDNFTKARIFANQEFDRRIGKAPRIKARTLIKDELSSWLLVKETEGNDYDTMNNVKRAARQIDEYWGEKFPSEISPDSISAWYSWWKVNHPDIQMENAVKYMRNFCNYLVTKVIDGSPLISAVPKLQDPNLKEIKANRIRKKEKIITREDFKKIFETAESDEHRLLVLFMYTMGSRITETLSLKFGEEMVKEDGVWIYRWRFGQNKADLDGRHHVHKKCWDLIERRKIEVEAMGTNLLFPQLKDKAEPLKEQQIEWQLWRDRAKASLYWTPHTFRHTCLTNLFSNPNAPQAMICKCYRVSIQTAMQSYIHVTDEARVNLSKIIEVDI